MWLDESCIFGAKILANSKRNPHDPPQEDREQVVGIPTQGSCDDELMTTKQLMSFLNLSRTKIWESVQYEGLPAFKIGGDYRYRKSEVLQWLERFRVQSERQRVKKS